MRSSEKFRHTKIIFTVGPSTCSIEKLSELICEGVDVCRINMAHADEAWTRQIMKNIREACYKAKREIATMIDVKGPEIRTGIVEQPIDLKFGDEVEFWTVEPPKKDDGVVRVDVNYSGLPKDLHAGATMLVDSGLIQLKVIESKEQYVKALVQTPGRLSSKRHINLPGVEIHLPSMTDKDRRDIEFSVDEGVDFVALSFVRNAQAVKELRNYLDSLNSSARIIAKIEDQAGLKNLEEIVVAADMIMVARGDLGIEISYEKLPRVQFDAVELCLKHGTPVIIATHLLESMISAPLPTRAEVSDVANAVKEQADCVMLSGETTMGAYPVESVRVMKNVIYATEYHREFELNKRIKLKTSKAKMLRSAAILADELGAASILVFTRSGFLPHVLAALRPKGIPIYAFTDVETIYRGLLPIWGVAPFFIEFNTEDPEDTIQRSFQMLLDGCWSIPDDEMVVITNGLAHGEVVDTLQLRKIPSGSYKEKLMDILPYSSRINDPDAQTGL
jgi:pyruvate kinase